MAAAEDCISDDYWDAEKMLDTYVHDYLLKKKFGDCAALFAHYTNVSRHRVEIDTPEGFLKEWWLTFWEVYSARGKRNNERFAQSSFRAPRWTGDELQNIYPAERKRHRIRQSSLATNITTMLGQPTTPWVPPMDLGPNMQRPDYERRAHMGPSASNASHQLMQLYNRPQQQDARVDRRGRGTRLSVPLDSTPYGAINPIPAQLNAGNNNMVGPTQLQGWPLTGVGSGPISSGMEAQLQNNSNFYHHQQQIQALETYSQTAVIPTSSQLQGGTTMHSINLKHPIIDLHEMMNYPLMKQAAEKEAVVFSGKSTQQQDEELLKLHEDIKEMMSMPNNSNGAGGESFVMMTPNTQTTDEQAVVPTRRNTEQQQDNQQPQLHKDAADAEVDNQVYEDVESYLSHNDENAEITETTLATLQPTSLSSNGNEPKGFSLEEVGTHLSNTKIVCCHFSSDGKFLVSGGHEKKVFLWDVDKNQFAKMDEVHSDIITDIRFRPNSTVFATSSSDTTVQLWAATKSSKSLLKLEGHGEQVMSLDFHPKKTDLLCSCDNNDEIRLWNVNNPSCCTLSLKGANRQVRFQPQTGKFLAAASGNTINLIDIETSSILHKFEGHSKDIGSLCWDIYGNQIASVSEDSARVWCVRSRKCEQLLNSNGNKFESCAFNPRYSQLLVIGSYQSLILWNAMENNKTESFHAHEGLISSIANSLRTGMIASASHDKSVKLWR